MRVGTAVVCGGIELVRSMEQGHGCHLQLVKTRLLAQLGPMEAESAF